METIAYMTFTVISILIISLVGWLCSRRIVNLAAQTASASAEAELRAQLVAMDQQMGLMCAQLSERDDRIDLLQEERANEIERRAAAEEIARRIPVLEGDRVELTEQLAVASARLLDLEKQKAELMTTVEKDREVLVEKVQLVDEAKKQLSGMFAELSSAALQRNNQHFLNLAKQSFELLHEGARVDLEKRQKNIEGLMAPVRESLEKVGSQILEMEIGRVGAYENLKQQVAMLSETELGLRNETANLARALGTPRVRGVWGEMQLRRVIELSGMLEHCDFTEQESVNTD